MVDCVGKNKCVFVNPKEDDETGGWIIALIVLSAISFLLGCLTGLLDSSLGATRWIIKKGAFMFESFIAHPWYFILFTFLGLFAFRYLIKSFRK